MPHHRTDFITTMTADEARMFAVYVAGLDRAVFRQAARLIERDRVALAHSLTARPTAEPDALVPAPRGATALYDWASDGAFPAGEAEAAEEPDTAAADAGYIPEPLPDELVKQATARFLGDVLAGTVPGVRQIKRELGVGQDRAQQVRGVLGKLADV
ncbi:hypothetical protein [Microtetraspora niveoalba]|uniref:hypothetical protein n=1 Tax=Microtetraspora niveoalba TaxID=46175 RepID=UPI0008354E04|nr:hypothetical protein [Microtetraspora niveoalba]